MTSIKMGRVAAQGLSRDAWLNPPLVLGKIPGDIPPKTDRNQMKSRPWSTFHKIFHQIEHQLSAKMPTIFPKLTPHFFHLGPTVRLQQQLRQFQGDLGLRIPHALPEEKETAELDHVVHGLGLKKKIWKDGCFPMLVGGFNMCNNHLEKYESQLGRMTCHILWKIENVPNHQSAWVRLPKTWGNQLRGAGRVIINGYNMMEHDTTMGTRPISWDGPNKTIENGDMAGDSDDCGMTCCFTQVRQWISSPYNWTNPTH